MMRTLTTLITSAAVLLALAGCTSGPKPAPSESNGSTDSSNAGSTDTPAGDIESLANQSTNKHLLAEEGGFKFYSLVPGNTEDGRLCVVVQSEAGVESKGCGYTNPYAGVGLGDSGGLVEARLVFSGYNAGKELAEGWRYLHPNLMVRGLDDTKSNS